MREKFPPGQKVIITSQASWYRGCEGTVVGKNATDDGVDVSFSQSTLLQITPSQRQSPVWFLYDAMTPKTHKRRIDK
jgi:hypothetical protein